MPMDKQSLEFRGEVGQIAILNRRPEQASLTIFELTGR